MANGFSPLQQGLLSFGANLLQNNRGGISFGQAVGGGLGSFQQGFQGAQQQQMAMQQLAMQQAAAKQQALLNQARLRQINQRTAGQQQFAGLLGGPTASGLPAGMPQTLPTGQRLPPGVSPAVPGAAGGLPGPGGFGPSQAQQQTMLAQMGPAGVQVAGAQGAPASPAAMPQSPSGTPFGLTPEQVETARAFMAVDPTGQKAMQFVARVRSQGNKQAGGAAAQLRAAGIDPQSPEGRSAILSNLRRPGTSVNVNTQGTTALNKALGQNVAKIIEGSSVAFNNRNTANRMRQLLGQIRTAGGDVGALTGARTEVNRLADAMGVDLTKIGVPDDAGPAQALQALSNQAALGKIGGEGGLPAAQFSEADREFVVSIVPQPTDTPEAFELKLQVLEQVNDRAIEMSQIATERAADNVPPAKIQQEIIRFRNNNPLFTGEQKKQIDQQINTANSAQAQFQEGQTATGPNGEKLIFQGGGWRPVTGPGA